jgi:hypothetical protein
MKKLLTLIVALLATGFTYTASAQCTTNHNTSVFLVPDTATDFSTAYTYTPYEQVLYIAVPRDTTVFSLPATFDSIVLVSITGLPSTITYTMNPANGIFKADSFACIQFTGTPTNADIGTHNLVINTLITGNVTLFGDTTLPIALNGYSIKVLDSASNGIHPATAKTDFKVFQNSPNPFGNETEIAFQSPGSENITIDIFDMNGSLVYHQEMISKKGYNSLVINGSTYKPGIYTYRVANGTFSFSKRMLVICQ